MSDDLNVAGGILALAVLLSGCANEPTYAPPQGPPISETCPIGEIWVCRDHYPSRLGREGEPPLHCMCQPLHGLR